MESKKKKRFSTQNQQFSKTLKNDQKNVLREEYVHYSDDYSSDENEFPVKKFVFTFSAEEWQQIEPQKIYYKLNDKNRPYQNRKSYYALPANAWTPVVAEHFWVHTQLECCISLQRANVALNGENYVTIIGRCTLCDSRLKGTVSEKPPENARVLMQCTYNGNFDQKHNLVKKRRLIGPVTEKALQTIIDNGISGETYREKEANRLMKIGNPEPTTIPTGGALRTLKWRYLSGNKRDKDELTSLALMKNESEFQNVLHDMGCEPFFIHYHSAEQINIYRNYCKTTKCPKLVIDATGSVINQFKKFGINKTMPILLYEALVYDEEKKQSFTVTNMLSESHSNISISNWLLKWISCDVPKPKQVVCNQSIALLSAIVQSFTQYTSLHDYLRVCSELLKGDIELDSHWLPRCFIRVDVAHFIKIACKWVPLKTITRLAKVMVLRTIGLLIKCQSLTELRLLILSLFVLLINDTNGADKINGEETPCEKHTNILTEATSTGFTDFKKQFDEIISIAETEDEDRDILEKEYERQDEGLDVFENPFQRWADTIYNESKTFIKEGTGINPFYCPELVSILIKSMKFLPLWSGVMIPIFRYGEEVSSSATVESSFKKLKTVTLKHITLPTSAEIFLENHISSLKRSSRIRSSRSVASSLSHVPENITTEDEGQLTIKHEHLSTRDVERDDSFQLVVDNKVISEVFNMNVGTSNGQNIVMNTFQSCNTENNHLTEEEMAREMWNLKSKKHRNLKSYLFPNAHLRHLDINNMRHIKSLPILKNGSRLEKLKSCKIKDSFERIILSNTCAFDTLTSILMVSYCDSRSYSLILDSLGQYDYLNFISNIVKYGITSATYSKRSEIIILYLKPELEQLEYNTTLAKCDSTMGHVITSLLGELPSIDEFVNCSSNICPKTFKRSVTYLTYQIGKGQNLSGLQSFIDGRTCLEKFGCEHNCSGTKTINSKLSTMHLFFDIFYLESDDLNLSQYSTESATLINVKLDDIPQTLINGNTTYEIRGAVHFIKGKSGLRNATGHYIAYTKRGASNNWELYDDLRKKSIPVKKNTIISCEFLVYTI